ncbi:hypothetical protein [Paenibacillus sp. S150]|uniref:hypothetical protein n=1 Tax=Paenibacillus sp. S150 TaxID=2749826 RepID=UPI001C584B83|nr:hypothetical protein [Paenibacillus sp. S150]MBW4080918.1 hypothetical protein [Paenibacillus sp. S150]
MPNQYVFNDNDQPVYVEITNTFQAPVIAAPPEMNASQQTVLFSAAASNSAVSILGTTVNISVRINNTAGSGRTLYVSRMSSSIGGTALLTNITGTFTIVKGGTLTSPSSITPVNNNLASPAVSVMTVQSSASAISGGTILYNYQLEPGMFAQDFTGSLIVPPGNALSINASCTTTVAGTIVSAVNVAWWES